MMRTIPICRGWSLKHPRNLQGLERLSKDWNSLIYVFFKPEPAIEYVNGRRVHVFECTAKPCKGRGGRYVRRYLDTGDAKSTGNLRRRRGCG
ncbi:hypothetical protein GALMADRAFT_241794 [Galerina marginata CBS 339.88]|uniref:Uncharacterized protein n=1 Tax=Galerina marginata (strain CBS 339.88) TaxID=685588 RepID=A0A067TDQ0_GALM3|nr:hypothetical protein GALMADRAFT_241794 [Galerina marginata CBS 339.88]